MDLEKPIEHILLVEDDEAHAEIIARAFKSSAKRIELVTAHNLQEARQRIHECHPDLMITDLVLPDGKGVELLSTGKDFPMVVMTSQGDEKTAVQAIKSGAMDYVVKSASVLNDMPQVVDRAYRQWVTFIQKQEAEQALQKANEELEERVRERTADLQAYQAELMVQNEKLRKTQQDIERSRNRYYDLYDCAPLSYFTFNNKGLVCEANYTGANLLGVKHEDLIGKDFSRFVTYDYRNLIKEHINHVFKERKKLTCELQLRRSDGVTFYGYLESVISQDENGEYRQVRTSITDITDRKRAEERISSSEAQYRCLVNNMPDHIVELDINCNVLFTNRLVPGFTLKEVIGRSMYEFLPEEQHNHLRNSLEKARQSGMICDYEVKCDDAAGNVSWWANRIVPVKEQGKIIRYLVIGSDITARKTAEEQARRYQEDLAQAARLNTIGEMSSGIAHELNQPLCAILNYTNVCLRMMNSKSTNMEKLRRNLENIALQAERSGQIIRRFRSFVRKQDLSRKSININDLVIEVVRVLEPDLLTSGAVVDMDLSEGLPNILLDSIQIEQVLINLVRNGIEAMQANDIQNRIIRIATSMTDSDEVLVEVTDHGHGMSTDIAAQIFNPFFTTKDDGLGIGLSISHTIIATHKGRIWASESSSGGTSMYFCLPVTGSVVVGKDMIEIETG